MKHVPKSHETSMYEFINVPGEDKVLVTSSNVTLVTSSLVTSSRYISDIM